MATIVVMPQLGNSVESCLIVNWLVAEGDPVAEGQILCEVETDKASMEVPSTAVGTVLRLLWSEGDDVPVKDPLVVLGAIGEDPAAALADAGWGGATADQGQGSATGTTSDPNRAVPEAAVSAIGIASTTTHGISPRARHLAAAKSLDVSGGGPGSGPGGRVIERDVLAALAAGPDVTRAAALAGAAGQAGAVGTGIGGRVRTVDVSARLAEAPADEASAVVTQTQAVPAPGGDPDYPGPSTTTPLKGIRKVIAERMMHSLASSAQLTYTSTARAQALLDLRKRFKNSDPALGMTGITIGDLVGYAAVRTASKHPRHNAHLENGTLTTFERVHMGFACDTPRGLLVPTIRNASKLSLGQFSAASKQLAADAIAGSISPDLLGGATFTVSNLGGFGIESFTPLLNVPQTAILGVDAIFPRVVTLADGAIGAEQRIGLSLTADHRVIDGADAARFLGDLVAFIENIDLAILA